MGVSACSISSVKNHLTATRTIMLESSLTTGPFKSARLSRDCEWKSEGDPERTNAIGDIRNGEPLPTSRLWCACTG
jgi:hypothetical protein